MVNLESIESFDEELKLAAKISIAGQFKFIF
jgi:hypothetical protein